MRYRYVVEKLRQATEVLDSGNGSVQKRIFDAFMSFHTLRVDDFPLECQETWKSIEHDLYEKGPIYGANGEVSVGSCQNTLNTMPDAKAKELAGRIVRIYWNVLPLNHH